MVKKMIKIIASVIFLLFICFIIFLAYIVVTDYKPQGIIPLTAENAQTKKIQRGARYKITTFNIGYCGLDKNQDFFMDGGSMSRSASKEQTLTNLKAVTNFLSGQDSSFILIQEADIDSSRSFHINQLAYLQKNFTQYESIFGMNYKVPWVPVPVTHPMGSVKSGLIVLSRYKTDSATRYQYPGNEKWLRQLFDLDRCFVELRLPVEGENKELVLINSHLSAFDEGGLIRKEQLEYLGNHIVEEYEKGNYVIVGGDWNHVLPGTDPKVFKTTEDWPFWLQTLPENFAPKGFSWAADKNTPSVRTDASSFKPDVNFRAAIDGFLVSPNVEIQKVYGHQLNFENSDHNPVSCEFILK